MLATGALAFVLYPLFFDAPRRSFPVPEKIDHADDGAIRALREIEFDRATGKLSDADYAELRRTYGAQALRELRAAAPVGPPAPAMEPDAIEARVHAYRASHRECRSCGLRPETDAIYCSTCGAYLDGRCPDCGTAIVESNAGYCSRCGAGLAAAAN